MTRCVTSKGYGRTPPRSDNGRAVRAVAVSFVINFEEGAEMSLSAGDALNEKVYEVTGRDFAGVADRCMESHFEYGTRRRGGASPIPLERLGVPGHRQHLRPGRRALALADPGRRGARPRDFLPWLALGRQRAHGGSRRARDDRPHGQGADRDRRARGPSAGTRARRRRPTRAACWSRKAASSTTATTIPTTCRSSSRCRASGTWCCPTASTPTTCTITRASTASCRPRDFADYTSDAFDTLWAEGEQAPKMMSIGLHLRMIGRPGRIAALDRIVSHMKQKGGAWFATRRQIAEHWIERFGHTQRRSTPPPDLARQVINRHRDSFRLLPSLLSAVTSVVVVGGSAGSSSVTVA